MAQASRPTAASRVGRPVRRRPPLAGVLSAGLFSALCYFGLTANATGPVSDPLDLGVPGAEPVIASLDFSGSKAVITGSVEHLFESAGFVGPNRAEKSDRFRPEPDVLEVARSFRAIRAELAALRTPVEAPEVIGQSRIETAEVADPPRVPEADEPRISVAAIDTTAALAAIDGVAPQEGVPVPSVASQQLAYARASAPITTEYTTGEVMRVAEKQLWCLSTAIYFEARGESYRGQVAVAQVVLNRVKDSRYPDTICAVVFQNQHRRNSCQFSFACDGIPEVINDRKSWAQAEEIAEKVTQGQLYLTEVSDATHYHATYVRPAWAPRMNKVTQIGLHVFYKFKSGWIFG